MSQSTHLPPTYEEVPKTSSNHNSNSNWEVWYRQFIKLDFNQDDAVKYAKLFVDNDIELNMIPELSDDILKGIGIETAGNRIRILRLQKLNSVQMPQQAVVAAATSQPVLNVPRCAWHPQIIANEKCYKCNRLICLTCRRERVYNGHARYYCPDCKEECIIL